MSGIPQTYNGKPLIHAWPYLDRQGKIIGIVGRYQDGSGKKDIVPFFKRRGSGWAAGAPDDPRPLFGLDRLEKQPKDEAVILPEGEKPAAALQGLGICAVTSLGGANAASNTDWTPFNGIKTVYIVPDNDAPGEHYAQTVYRALMALDSPPTVKIIRLEGLPDGGDIVDWLQGFVAGWDGYTPIAENLHKPLKEEFLEALNTAEPVPDSWRVAHSGNAGLFVWEPPNPIADQTPPVQALPPELIPEPYRAWLADVSHRMQTPMDFAVISAIVITGSVIGAGCGIRPKRLDDFEVIPNLWGACIGRPSVVLKSPSMKEPMQLLDRLQADYGEQFESDKAAAEFDSVANDAMLDDVKNRIKKAAKGHGTDGVVKPDEITKLRADYLELTQNATPEVTRRLFKTNETSIQSMTVLQNQNPRGILVFRDELMGLLAGWDREDKADERAYFLEGWNGNGSYTDFKIMRGLTDAKNVCISLLGGIQPDKLKRYLYHALQGNNDGLMQRLQLAVWPDEPEHWELVDTVPNKADKQRAYGILNALAELDFIGQGGAVQSGDDDRPFFRFDQDGQAVFNSWFTELQTVKIAQEENPLMAEHLGKFRSLMPSLALIFHCIDVADGKARGDVSAQAARLAVAWCGYLESHARRIYAMAESPEHAAAVRLAGKIKAKALPNPFTAKDVYKKHWHGLDKPEVDAACNVLIDENWLMMARKPKPATGRPPLPEYHINPIFL
ncbi:DUF3987 domain-containing protein [Methylovulum psychrotolerans]|uniref:DUF3987 domain-containing protein n=1 Tax=Methylovulum psychrotolerans TaxID=1704499 RepID=UPI001BFF415B|nr:YfjI family protein [Methylovulum psychrotolerans]MBT9096405.1 DUF3987 domain-containing protein [Methylovulum psychrotolerans]